MGKDYWRIVAYLDEPLLGKPPALDAVIVGQRQQGQWQTPRAEKGEQWAVDSLRIPLRRGSLNGTINIPRVSSALWGREPLGGDWIAEAAARRWRFHPSSVSVLTWFAKGDGPNMLDLLGKVGYLGGSRNAPGATVGRWVVEAWPHDWAWLAQLGGVDETGKAVPHLMRPLPEPEHSRIRCCGEFRAVTRWKPPYRSSEPQRCVVPVWAPVQVY